VPPYQPVRTFMQLSAYFSTSRAKISSPLSSTRLTYRFADFYIKAADSSGPQPSCRNRRG